MHRALWILRRAAVDVVIAEQLLQDGTGAALLWSVRAMGLPCKRVLISSHRLDWDGAASAHDMFFLKTPDLAGALADWLAGVARTTR